MRTLNSFLALVIFLLAPQCVEAQAPPPTLLTEENSSRAVAFDSVTHVRSPLAVVSASNLAINDHRARLVLFGINVDLLPGENASAVTAVARDSRSRNFNLAVESVRKVSNQDWLTQILVRLPDGLSNAGDVWITISLHGQTSNEVLFGIAVQTEPRTVTLPARRVVNGVDNYYDACFSFEFGLNGEGSLRLTRNDWDIEYGNSFDADILDVSMVGDDRSRIMDLGALNWSDSFQVPVLPAHPVPTREPTLVAIVGHMYVVHTRDTETDLYTLFRVEALDHLRSVTISWKSVQSPE